MSENPVLQADTPAKIERLAEIARMADLLTDQLLNNQIMGLLVSTEGIRALLGASSLLKDYGQAIPPLLGQIVQDFGDLDEAEPPKTAGQYELEEAARLAHALRPIQKLDGQAT